MISLFRNSDGLIADFVYPRNVDNSINWTALIRPEHLYPKNKKAQEEIEMRFGKKFAALTEDEIAQISPRQLLVTLAGINHLAWLRGIKSSVPQPPIVTQNEVTSVWVVEFLPNTEDPAGLTVAGQASASLYSVSGAFQQHLAALAGNRAYIRAVRQALRIEILGKDEFDPEATEKYEKALKEGRDPRAVAVEEPAGSSGPVAITPYQRLAQRCGELGFTFEQVKTSALKIRAEMIANPESAKLCRINDDPNDWAGFDNIKPLDCMTMLDRVNTAAEKKVKKK